MISLPGLQSFKEDSEETTKTDEEETVVYKLDTASCEAGSLYKFM